MTGSHFVVKVRPMGNINTSLYGLHLIVSIVDSPLPQVPHVGLNYFPNPAKCHLNNRKSVPNPQIQVFYPMIVTYDGLCFAMAG